MFVSQLPAQGSQEKGNEASMRPSRIGLMEVCCVPLAPGGQREQTSVPLYLGNDPFLWATGGGRKPKRKHPATCP